jgi:hypothetical protein
MEELLQLRKLIECREYDLALDLISELEEMSREDKLAKNYCIAVILLIHLIKQKAENHSTRSWEFSIYNSSKEIKRVNKRKKAGSYYASDQELQEILTDAFDTAIKKAALEAFEGIYTDNELRFKIDENEIKHHALGLISE